MKTYTHNSTFLDATLSYSNLADSGVKKDAGLACSSRQRNAIATLKARSLKTKKAAKNVVYDFVGIAG